jgi:hypothetical protein
LPQSGSGEGTTSRGAQRSPELNQPSKTRVLDEMQSDWAQRARDHGFRDASGVPALRAAWKEAEMRKENAYDGLYELVSRESGSAPGATSDLIAEAKGLSGGQEAIAAFRAAENEMMDLTNKIQAAEGGVPSAPYISNTSDWVDLGLKQALIDAAKDPSVNRLAWAPGKVQADRYNLKNTISGIRYSPETKSLQVTRPYDDAGKWYGFEGGDNVTPEALPGLVGKDLAEKLLAAPKQAMGRGSPYDAHTLTDLGSVEIGGHGMRSFYGDMTPEGYQSGIVGTRLQKLVKGLDPEAARVEPHPVNGQIISAGGKWGVNTGKGVKWYGSEAEAHQAASYPSVSITPAMREKILKEGLPLFNIAALSALVQRILDQGQPGTEGEDGGGF